MNDALVAALRETPTVSSHLHVPLQSGDDGVLRAMRRRYTTSTYLRRLAPLADEFNLTSDVIVGFPAEDDAAFEQTLAHRRARGPDEGARLPVLAAAGNRHRGRRPRPAACEEGARRAAARALARAVSRAAGAARSARRTSVLVDRPGRGYGDDYSPWLVDAPVGALVRVRGAAATEEGILAEAA